MKQSGRNQSDPDRYDPNVVGPFDVCIRCFTPSADERTYCLNCGRNGTFFDLPGQPSRQMCFVHAQTSASIFCTLCARPICTECKDREGFSFIAVRSTPQCRSCLDDMERIEAGFFLRLSKAGVCAKHAHKPAQAACIECQLPLCNSCQYFRKRGFLFHREVGPYCLACYRSAK